MLSPTDYYFDVSDNHNLVTDQYGSILFTISLKKGKIGYFAVGFNYNGITGDIGRTFSEFKASKLIILTQPNSNSG